MKLIRDGRKHTVTDSGDDAKENQKVEDINTFVCFYPLFLVNLLYKKIVYM